MECVTCAPGPHAGSCTDELANRCGLGRSREELPARPSEGTRLRLVSKDWTEGTERRLSRLPERAARDGWPSPSRSGKSSKTSEWRSYRMPGRRKGLGHKRSGQKLLQIPHLKNEEARPSWSDQDAYLSRPGPPPAFPHRRQRAVLPGRNRNSGPGFYAAFLPPCSF